MITKLTYKTSVFISERTQYISVVKRDILMLCREIISIYFENPTYYIIHWQNMYHPLTYLLTYLLHGAESFLRS